MQAKASGEEERERGKRKKGRMGESVGNGVFVQDKGWRRRVERKIARPV